MAHGKFTNQDRGSGGGEMGDTSTGTYFGEMSDGDGGEEAPAQIQNVYNIDTKAIVFTRSEYASTFNPPFSFRTDRDIDDVGLLSFPPNAFPAFS